MAKSPPSSGAVMFARCRSPWLLSDLIWVGRAGEPLARQASIRSGPRRSQIVGLLAGGLSYLGDPAASADVLVGGGAAGAALLLFRTLGPERRAGCFAQSATIATQTSLFRV